MGAFIWAGRAPVFGVGVEVCGAEFYGLGFRYLMVLGS